MKGFISGGLSALLIATSASGLSLPIFAKSVQAQMVFNFSAPFITDSGVLGSNHFIKVAVLGMSLQDLTIGLPSQMEDFEGVRVTDSSGKVVPASISKNKENVTINFAQPVPPDTSLKVELTGVEMITRKGEILLYEVTAQRVGIRGSIPIGTAIVNVPDRS